MTDEWPLEEMRLSVLPLVRAFRLREVSAVAEPQYVVLRYANDTTGVEFRVEWTELRASVTLFKLTSEGEFVELTEQLQSEDEVRPTFNADDLLILRRTPSSPVGRRLHRKGPGEVAGLMKRYAESLLKDAADIFSGDFQVFHQLNRVVSDRVQRLERE